jgi:hypothetical protein
MEATTQKKREVKITTMDGKDVFIVDRDILGQSSVIAEMLQDDIEEEIPEIPLNHIEPEILTVIISCLKQFKEEPFTKENAAEHLESYLQNEEIKKMMLLTNKKEESILYLTEMFNCLQMVDLRHMGERIIDKMVYECPDDVYNKFFPEPDPARLNQFIRNYREVFLESVM